MPDATNIEDNTIFIGHIHQVAINFRARARCRGIADVGASSRCILDRLVPGTAIARQWWFATSPVTTTTATTCTDCILWRILLLAIASLLVITCILLARILVASIQLLSGFASRRLRDTVAAKLAPAAS